MRNNISVINVYKKKSVKSEIVTQLLYGDTFKRLKKFGSWVKIKNDTDNYKGYIKNKNFPPNHKNTHKIHKLHAGLYFTFLNILIFLKVFFVVKLIFFKSFFLIHKLSNL